MIRKYIWKLLPLFLVLNLWGISRLSAQGVLFEGYVFESDNRGYLNEVMITLSPKEDPENKLKIRTDQDGYFQVLLPPSSTFLLTAEKPLFFPTNQDISTYEKQDGDKVFGKIELNRQPGYYFDVTLAEEKAESDSIVEGIMGATIEIYNNTKQEDALVLHNYPHPNFSYTFQQGNHYTILIRKSGYFGKRLEALVNIDGCILCFDGLASIESVTDNLTAGHQMGSILANIVLKKADPGASFKINNILYDLDQSEIRPEAAIELDRLVSVLRDNKEIQVELGSHTDSRGGATYNLKLSQRRAEAAVAYLVSKGISSSQISAQGYGESNLLNNCADGVECSEHAHQENRRTEIKVLDVLTEAVPQPLSEIKRIELMEETIRQLENQEIIEVALGSEIPDDLQAILERSNQPTSKVVSPSAALQDSAPKILDDSAPNQLTNNNEKPGRMKVEEQPMVKEQKATSRSSAMDEKVRKESRFLAAMGRPAKKGSSALLFPKVPDDYTGFMVQILVSQEPLATLDPTLNQFPVIRVEESKHGEYKYLVGTFTEIIDALEYFDEKIQESYPNAKIIEFISGKRL